MYSGCQVHALGSLAIQAFIVRMNDGHDLGHGRMILEHPKRVSENHASCELPVLFRTSPVIRRLRPAATIRAVVLLTFDPSRKGCGTLIARFVVAKVAKNMCARRK